MCSVLPGFIEGVRGIGKLIVSGDCKGEEPPPCYGEISIVDRGAIKGQCAGTLAILNVWYATHTPSGRVYGFNSTYIFWPVWSSIAPVVEPQSEPV